jgi:hypothetical protein
LDQSGLFVGLLGGLALDPRNAIGAEATLGFFGGFRGEAIDEFGDYYYDSYTPKMLAGEFKYLHSFSTGGSRVRAEVGAGFYGTILQMSAESDFYSLYGQMAGFGFGGSLGLAWQLVLGDSVTFDTYARGRLATTSRIKGESSLGEIGLAKTDEGLVWWDFASYIESGGAEWANVDYTGFEGGVAIAFHY